MLQLVGAPLVMRGLTVALGLDGDLQGTLIVLDATPTAVTPVLMATEFGSQTAVRDALGGHRKACQHRNADALITLTR